jgi:hypothetical protein
MATNNRTGLPGRSVRRGSRRGLKSALSLGLAAVTAGTFLALNPLGGAQAAQPNSQLITAAYSEPSGGVSFDRSFPLILNDGGTARIGANPDGSGNINVDDILTVIVTRQNGSQVTVSHTFNDEGCTADVPRAPLNVPVLPGNNVVRVIISDNESCGAPSGAITALWLAVNGQPTTMRANPSVAEVATEDPLAEAFLTLSAKLTETGTSYPIAGRIVEMRSGDANGDIICTDVTDADGEAACGFVVPDGLLAIPAYTAVFQGDAFYAPSQDTAPLIVLGGSDILPV